MTGPQTNECPRCVGQGVLHQEGYPDELCPRCDGTGHLPLVDNRRRRSWWLAGGALALLMVLSILGADLLAAHVTPEHHGKTTIASIVATATPTATPTLRPGMTPTVVPTIAPTATLMPQAGCCGGCGVCSGNPTNTPTHAPSATPRPTGTPNPCTTGREDTMPDFTNDSTGRRKFLQGAALATVSMSTIAGVLAVGSHGAIPKELIQSFSPSRASLSGGGIVETFAPTISFSNDDMAFTGPNTALAHVNWKGMAVPQGADYDAWLEYHAPSGHCFTSVIAQAAADLPDSDPASYLSPARTYIQYSTDGITWFTVSGFGPNYSTVLYTASPVSTYLVEWGANPLPAGAQEVRVHGWGIPHDYTLQLGQINFTIS